MGSILHDLKIDIRTFREIAVLSGSDYNTIEKIHLYKAFKLYGEYKKILADVPFYTWLQQNNYIQELDVLQRAYDMFVVSCDDVDTTKYVCVMGEQKKDELHKILELDGFLTL